MKKAFTPSKNSQETAKIPAAKTAVETLPPNDHQFSFGAVYANDPAKAELEKENPRFPVGSIIVREKLPMPTSEIPQTVIAMVKREKGFSEKTGDWEFFVFNGPDLKLNSRETIGNCSACHVRAVRTDWVFPGYLK